LLANIELSGVNHPGVVHIVAVITPVSVPADPFTDEMNSQYD
jgi:hypothetical protein